jgi:chitinase
MPIYKNALCAASLMFCISNGYASSTINCLQSTVDTSGWTNNITLTNKCEDAIDLQNTLVQFTSAQNISGSYWGSFGSLAYPSTTSISSTSNGSTYTVQLPLNFPTGNQWWQPNTKLPVNDAIKLQFSGSPSNSVTNVQVYGEAPPPAKLSSLVLKLSQAPSNNLPIPTITIKNGSDVERKITSLNWNNSYEVKALPAGSYNISAASVTANGKTYQAQINPSQLTLQPNNSSNIQINYQQVIETGSVIVRLAMPQPSSSIANPTIHIKDLTTNQTLSAQTVNWSNQIEVANLTADHQYQFSSNTIESANYKYVPSLSPSSTVTIDPQSTSVLNLSFDEQPLAKSNINVAISGLPDAKTTVLTATDQQGNQYHTTLGNGHDQAWSLPVDKQYQLSATALTVNGINYSANLQPTQLFLSKDQSSSLSVNFSEQQASYHFSPYVDITLGTITKWDSTTQSMQPTGLIDVVKNAQIDALHLAFVTGKSGCQATWAGYPVSLDENGYGNPVFKQLRQQGVNLTVALGGLSGQYLAQVCQSTDALAAAYDQVVQAYQPHGLDFDVENAMQANNEQLDRMMQAIQIIKAKYPDLKISFTLPVLPSGLVTGLGENVIARAAHNGLDDYEVNIMAMDYGPSFTQKTMAEYGIEAATNTKSQLKKYYPEQSEATLWHRMGITPMIGLNDTLPLNFSITDAQALKAFAIEKNIGLLSYWSITRDHPCNSSYVSITCSSQNPANQQANQEADYQYAKTMK